MSGKFVNLSTAYYQAGTIPLLEYPRPNFIRESYLNLNGLWDFAIAKSDMIGDYEQQILVPFSPETSLSGVGRAPKNDEYLFYHRQVTFPADFRKDIVVLHFGAVDQEVDVFINGHLVKSNRVPFLPFKVDLSEVVGTKGFDITLRIKDKTRQSTHLIGKQSEQRGGIWYTPQSGVWQTIWLESYALTHLSGVKIHTNYDEETVLFILDKSGSGEVELAIYDGEERIEMVSSSKREIKIKIANFKAWSPDSPHLYDVVFKFGGETIRSYFAFRKIEKRKDERGISRFYLNNKPIFQSGVLDQGYYSDGLLTPPSDEAMIDDIKLLKRMGFNMLRKHIKVEPLRFYYHCDRLGILVWQDMINLVPPKNYNANALEAMLFEHHLKDSGSRYGVTSPKQKENYYIALKQMIELLSPFPSIVTWVPFNEGWGQFDAQTAVDLIKEIDDTRLIDHASGWSDQKIGDYYSRHIYFTPLGIRRFHIKNRIIAITEFGGYSLKIEGHVFNQKKTFGYRVYKTRNALAKAFKKLYLHQVKPLIKKGLSVIIYTQLSDVEDEVNGLITYDRKIVKFDENHVKMLNESLYSAFDEAQRL